MCILLVEDEPLIRLILTEELEFQGFEICQAPNGDEAAFLIENPPQAFTVLITDIHMPGRRDGFEVVRLMRLHHPALPVIYTTGRPDALDAAGPLGPRSAALLKPYRPSQLVGAVRRLLAEA